ncbi:efflux transporter outer membrane subunit [uncultured Ramlibacter sp.]|uniref:efflux transporter outer membrane subunit n=1 Tax=uncultured Ramlibacter sp. TaxID=260755 RepID=UPI002627B3E6|nr:efflux transporter outer membrane subunit [uncultured Ramlibacter sp.]
MKKLHILAAASAALWLAGCALPRPPASVAAPTPPQWYAPLPHNGTIADLSQWWRQVGDPLLAELVDAAQALSPSVASARSRIEQARASRVAAGAALLPSLDGTASANRSNTQLGLAQAASTAQVGLQAGWEIDLFGANRAAVDAAQARFEGDQAGWHEARVSVAAETVNSYVALRTCGQQLAVALNDAASRAETARLTGISAGAGFTAPADAALARGSAAEGAARAKQQRALCDVELKALVALTGMAEPLLRQKVVAAPMIVAQDAMLSVASLPAQVLAQRPDVYRAEREVAAASAEVGAARADRYPRLQLSGTVGAGRIRVGGVDTDLNTWSIGPLAMTLPLFDGGRRAANVDAAQVRYEEAATLYAANVRQAVREVEQALVNLDSARGRDQDTRVAAEGYRTAFNATEVRYRNGLASLVELEDTRRTALASETALVALQRERIAAWVALYRAVGGGWSRPEEGAATAQR